MQRLDYLNRLHEAFQVHPLVALLGPRQCGKTTLAHAYAKFVGETMDVHFFDLEDDADLAQLENPRLALADKEGLIVIDEVQLRPDLFPMLRVLIDAFKGKQRYLILGSASRELIRQSSETLAGRIAYMELTPFTLDEVGDLEQLWQRGGFPLSYLATSEKTSLAWRKQYIRTFLEQDIPQLGIQIPAQALRRFWTMLAHYHGNIFNASELGRSLALSDPTMRRYLDILTGTFMIRQLQPWFENINKRQIKAPKIIFRDSGILHSLLGIDDKTALIKHPKLGASWEGFAIEQIIHIEGADPQDCYFWGTHGGAELDLLLTKQGQRLGFECKYQDAPKLTKSMHIAMDDLKLNHLTVIYPGTKHYKLAEQIEVRGLGSLRE